MHQLKIDRHTFMGSDCHSLSAAPRRSWFTVPLAAALGA